MEYRLLRGARGQIVNGDLDVPPIGVILAAFESSGRPHRADDEFASYHHGPFAHEPRPRAIVVQLHQGACDVIRLVGRSWRVHGRHANRGKKQKRHVAAVHSGSSFLNGRR